MELFLRLDPETGELLSTTPGLLFNEDQAGVMSPDGSRLVVPGPDRRVRLLDVEEQEYIGHDSKTPWGSSPTYAPDGSQFALVQAERIRLWDGRTGEYQASLPLPSRTGTFSITYRPDSAVWSSPPPTAGPGPWTREQARGQPVPARQRAGTSQSRTGSSSSRVGPTGRPVLNGRRCAEPAARDPRQPA